MNQGNQCFPQLMAENRRQGRWRENERSERNSTRSNNHVACVFRGIISDYIRIFVVFNECWIWIFSLFWYSRKPIKNRMYGDNWETEHKPKQMSSESSFVISLDSFDSDMNMSNILAFRSQHLKPHRLIWLSGTAELAIILWVHHFEQQLSHYTQFF